MRRIIHETRAGEAGAAAAVDAAGAAGEVDAAGAAGRVGAPGAEVQ